MKTVWATMITPFNADKTVDYEGLKAVTEWYINKGIDGLFAVCQSSEMFFLTQKERVKIAQTVMLTAKGRVPVVASGHISDSLPKQMKELKAMRDTGVDSVVMVTNRLMNKDMDENLFKLKTEKIFDAVPECEFGLYECPYPFKALLSDRLLSYCAGTGRIHFIKDTCCDIDIIKRRSKITKDTGLKLYNANTATLLESLKCGYDGFCGVMTNYHPELYTSLVRGYNTDKALLLQHFATVAGNMPYRGYPNNAKYFISLDKVPIKHYCRANPDDSFTVLMMDETKQFYQLCKELKVE